MVAHNITRERDNAIGARHLKASHHQLVIGAHPVLYFRHDLCVVPPAGAARCPGYEHTEDADEREYGSLCPQHRHAPDRLRCGLAIISRTLKLRKSNPTPKALLLRLIKSCNS